MRGNAPSPARQAVAGILGLVAQHEFPLDQQPLLDRPQRSLNARIVGREKADHRDQQQARVEPLGAVGLHEAVEFAIEPALADFGMDFVGDRAPAPPPLRGASAALHCAARSNATQAITLEWTKCCGPPRTSQMPFVRLAPSPRQIVEHDRPQARPRSVTLHAGLERLEHRVGDLAEYIDLQLLVGGIADPHRRRVLVAGQPRDDQFRQPALAAYAVHDLHLAGLPATARMSHSRHACASS